jgi:hypothetical protein
MGFEVTIPIPMCFLFFFSFLISKIEENVLKTVGRED